MSRGFVKEDDQEEAPMIPPRAALPAGAENYVTAEGYQALLEEKQQLLEERKQTRKLADRDRRRENGVIDGKIVLLEERIHSARILEKPANPTEVRFGVTVTFRPLSVKAPARTFKIVGVDEASIKQQKVAFVAPIVKAMTGKKVGDRFEFGLGGNNQAFEITEVK